MHTIFAAAWLLATPAQAVPAQFTHQGRLIESDGAPTEGPLTITFRITTSDEGGTILWEEAQTLPLLNGFYSTVLGANEETNPLDTDVLSMAPVWLELQVEGEGPMYPRSPVNSVPYAAMATVAEEVAGGPVDASQIAVAGTPVVNESGEWVGPAPTVNWTDIEGMPEGFADGIDDDTDTDTDSFATLGESCLDGDIPVWDAVAMSWVCDMDGDTLALLDCDDGKLIQWSDDATGWVCADDADTVLTEDEVDAMVADNGYAMATAIFSGNFADLTGIPADLADGDDNTQLSEAEVDEMVSNNGYAMAGDAFSGSFTDLTDVPDGLTDDSDALNELACTTGQFVVKTDTGWACTDPAAVFDGDTDGIVAWMDCDDSDPGSTTIATDADCDGVLTENDCVDTDASVTSGPGTASECPYRSCAHLKAVNPSAPSGDYWVDPDGSAGLAAFSVYCDQETHDGGWALAAVINGDSSAHVDRSAVGSIGYPEDDSAAKLSDQQMNALSAWDGSASDSVYRFTCNGQTDFLRYEVGWNSTSTNDELDFTYRYACGEYTPCVTTESWSYYDGGTSGSDRGGGSYPQFDATQYQADGNTGCYHEGYHRSGLLWVR